MTAMTLESARDRLAEIIQQHDLPMPDMTMLSGPSVLLVRLADAADIAPWSAALRAEIRPGRETAPDGSRRWSLSLARCQVTPGLWLDVWWEGPWRRRVPILPDGVTLLPIGGRHGRRAGA